MEKTYQTRQLGQGIIEFKDISFDDFRELVSVLPIGNILFRGQEHDWPLKPRLKRLLEEYGIEEENPAIADHLQRFKLACRGRRSSASIAATDDEDSWWTLGQHYGLATPLLDWTRSPFVALFFALEHQPSQQPRTPVVYVLVHRLVELAAQLELKERESKIKADSSPLAVFMNLKPAATLPIFRVVEPLMEDNPRLVAQQAVSIKWEWGQPLEEVVSTCMNGRESWGMLKFLLKIDDYKHVLKQLDFMNINRLTLFPDLSGAADFCNYALRYDVSFQLRAK